MRAFHYITLCFISTSYPLDNKGDRTWLSSDNQKQRLPKQPKLKHRYVKSRTLSKQYR